MNESTNKSLSFQDKVAVIEVGWAIVNNADLEQFQGRKSTQLKLAAKELKTEGADDDGTQASAINQAERSIHSIGWIDPIEWMVENLQFFQVITITQRKMIGVAKVIRSYRNRQHERRNRNRSARGCAIPGTKRLGKTSLAKKHTDYFRKERV